MGNWSGGKLSRPFRSARQLVEIHVRFLPSSLSRQGSRTLYQFRCLRNFELSNYHPNKHPFSLSLPVLQFRQSRVYFIICNHYESHNQIWHVRVATTNFSLFCNIDSSFQKYLPHPGSIFSKYLKLKYWIWHCSFNNWRNFLLQQFLEFLTFGQKGTVG